MARCSDNITTSKKLLLTFTIANKNIYSDDSDIDEFLNHALPIYNSEIDRLCDISIFIRTMTVFVIECKKNITDSKINDQTENQENYVDRMKACARACANDYDKIFGGDISSIFLYDHKFSKQSNNDDQLMNLNSKKNQSENTNDNKKLVKEIFYLTTPCCSLSLKSNKMVHFDENIVKKIKQKLEKTVSNGFEFSRVIEMFVQTRGYDPLKC